MGALRHGIPIVAIPLPVPDNRLNAARVAQLGAGIAVDEDERSPDTIRDALRSVLQEPRYRDAARKVAAEMADLPPFTDAVVLIERLARQRQPILTD
jgi:UDP:flavonoid glycosyltransferase YjiC (YdhE family)